MKPRHYKSDVSLVQPEGLHYVLQPDLSQGSDTAQLAVVNLADLHEREDQLSLASEVYRRAFQSAIDGQKDSATTGFLLFQNCR